MVFTHLSTPDLQRFRQGTMAVATLLEVDRHLAACAECARRLVGESELGETLALLQAELAEAESQACAYFTFEQKAAYVNDELSAQELTLAALHLEICPECHLEIEELRVLRARLPLQREYAPPTVPTLWERLRALWELPALRWPLQGLGIAAAMVLVIWLVNSVWRVSSVGPSSRLGQPQETQQNVLTKRGAEAQAAPSRQSPAQPDLPAALTAQPSQMVLALQDGKRQITLDQRGNLSGLDALSPASQETVKVALTTQRVKISPLLSEVRGASVQLLGGQREPNEFSLLSPVSKVVQAARPPFRWQALAGASNYYVTIYDTKLKSVASSAALSSTEWTPEEELERGQLYLWQVRAIKEGQEYFAPAPSSPDAKFRILGRPQAEELERVKNAQPSHLALGILYAQAGLLEEASQEFQTLYAANPHSAVVQKLLQSVNSQRRERR